MKRLTALMLVLCMLLTLLVGCGSTEPAADPTEDVGTEEPAETPEAPAEEEEAPAEEPADSTITVTDQAGNTVTLEQPAESVVTCFYGQSYAMIALGMSDKVVAMEAKADTRPIYAMAAPEMLELPNVGSMKEFNVEAAIAADPDIVLLPMKLKDHAESFAAVDIPVAICNPESQELLEEMLVMIATLCGDPAAAEELIAYYDATFAEVEALTADLTEEDKPVVYMAGNSDYLTTAPATMYQAGLIENAGGINAAAAIEGDYWTEVSYEQILEMNPDIIILPCDASYGVDAVLGDASLAGVTAVTNGAVYAMPNSFEAWDSPVPSAVLGTLWLLATIHGDLYSMDEMRADAAEFYSTFYGCEIDIALIN